MVARGDYTTGRWSPRRSTRLGALDVPKLSNCRENSGTAHGIARIWPRFWRHFLLPGPPTASAPDVCFRRFVQSSFRNPCRGTLSGASSACSIATVFTPSPTILRRLSTLCHQRLHLPHHFAQSRFSTTHVQAPTSTWRCVRQLAAFVRSKAFAPNLSVTLVDGRPEGGAVKVNQGKSQCSTAGGANVDGGRCAFV